MPLRLEFERFPSGRIDAYVEGENQKIATRDVAELWTVTGYGRASGGHQELLEAALTKWDKAEEMTKAAMT